MAEARSIALLGASPSSIQRISLGYDDAGLRIRCETVIPPPAAAARKVLRAVRHLIISAGYTLYPVPPLSALAAGTVFVAYVLGAPPDAWVRSGGAASALWAASAAAALVSAALAVRMWVPPEWHTTAFFVALWIVASLVTVRLVAELLVEVLFLGEGMRLSEHSKAS